MKKYLCLGLALLTMSCSSDDEKEEYPPQNHFKQYQVDIRVVKADLDEKNSGGNMGVYLFGEDIGNIVFDDGIGNIAFDRACPVEWHLEKEQRGLLGNVSIIEGEGAIRCNKCGSSFSFPSMLARGGKAKELGYKLVAYDVLFDSNSQEYHVTNPNYKE